MHSSPMPDEMIQRLASDLEGEVIGPTDAAYDEARTPFYGGFDRRPAVIVRPADTAEVAYVVKLAGETGHELAVRSGGHSISAHSVVDGGIVIDLAALTSLEIDSASRTAWAGGGLKAGAYTTAAGVHGLATGFGDTGSVGIGGITLGGGVGFLSRKYGLTIDSLQAAEVVTADGSVLMADEANHPDLFWALRGGGGNFGVVTRFHFRLHPVDRIVGGMLMLPATADAITAFVELAEEAPAGLSTIATAMKAPPMPMVPAAYHGQLVLMGLLAFTGPEEEGAAVVAPFRSLAEPLVDMLGVMPYPDLFPGEEMAFHPVARSHNGFADHIGEAEAEAILEHLRSTTAMMAAVQLRVLGGAVAEIPNDATAYAHRHRNIMTNVGAVFGELSEAPAHAAWVESMAGALRQGDDGAYVNFVDDNARNSGPAYPEATMARLRQVKAEYDPENLFHLNHNIAPA